MMKCSNCGSKHNGEAGPCNTCGGARLVACDNPPKLYRVFNGTLETATFVKEQTLGNDAFPSWVVRYDKDGRKAQTAPDYWEATERDAWEKYYTELSGYGPAVIADMKNAQKKVDDWLDQVNVVADRIKQLSV
jgi:hypothetical protein